MDVSDEDADNLTESDMESRIYTVAELRSLRCGTVFMHPTLGKGMIRKDKYGKKEMVWKGNHATAAFHFDAVPWNEPMIRLN